MKLIGMGVSKDRNISIREVSAVTSACGKLLLDCGDVGEDGAEVITSEYLVGLVN